jgi:transposase-like protein
MGLRYSEAFIEQALIKIYSRGDRTVRSVAEELNVNCHTVRNWLKRKSVNVSNLSVSATKEKRPQDWNAEAQ